MLSGLHTMTKSQSLLSRPTSPLASGAVSDTLEKIGSAIASGRYPVGTTLPMENELVEEYGVSRTVVREAVKVLTVKGMLKTARRYGTVVTPIADWNLLDSGVLSWHDPDSPNIQTVYSELAEILSVILPQAAFKAAAKGGGLDRDLAKTAICALTVVDQYVRAQAEYTLWATIIDGVGNGSFAHFKGMMFELSRLTYELESAKSIEHPNQDAHYKALIAAIGNADAADTDLQSRLIFKRATDLASNL